MEREAIETKTAKIWLSEDGFICLKILPGSSLSVEDMKAQLKVVSNLAGNKIIPILVDSRGVKSIDRDARVFIQKEGNKIVSSLALLIGSPVSRLIGNLFLGINKPSYPIMLFTSEDKAIAWLKRTNENNQEENAL